MLLKNAIRASGKGIEKYYVSTPVTFKDFTGSPEGSGYGILKDCKDPLQIDHSA